MNTQEENLTLDLSSPALLRNRKLRKAKDSMARHSIVVGGLSVIMAITLIFFYLLWEVLPMFAAAEMEHEQVFTVADQQADVLYLDIEEQNKVTTLLDRDGMLRFVATHSGETLGHSQVTDTEITTVARGSENSTVLAVGDVQGHVSLMELSYDVTFPNNVKTVNPAHAVLSEDGLDVFDGEAIADLAFRDDEEEASVLAVSESGRVVLIRLIKEESFLSDEITLEEDDRMELASGLPGVHVLMDSDQDYAFVVHSNGQIDVFSAVSGMLNGSLKLNVGGDITASSMLLGGLSLLLGDSTGGIHQLFMVRDENNHYTLTHIRSFEQGNAPITQILSEKRRKAFVAADASGVVAFYAATAENKAIEQQVFTNNQSVNVMAISPRANALVVAADNSTFNLWHVENEHPDVSWSALWGKVWYESYQEADYIWQSSAANNDFEPKYSLMPLAFGTLKAAFYAMLMATPLAICGAMFTAYFMAPGMRKVVKPTIELMEALPTVILGFLAGLWLAPLIESSLPGIFSILVLMPVLIVLFAWFWTNLPSDIRSRVPEGWEPALLIPVIGVSIWVPMMASGWMEATFFDGSMRQWLTNDIGIAFDQRNALVVGLAMGFAVIPTIFSIAEDALFAVPRHLTNGSLALGATAWQTLIRVVLPTASPGIFSAVMIGFGRAVGETMIVLMATGNTPVMEMNIFEGLRTLSANIAVELPESEVGSTHFRILFLAALCLFLFTFLFNTSAEIVRNRLRKKYGSL